MVARPILFIHLIIIIMNTLLKTHWGEDEDWEDDEDLETEELIYGAGDKD